MLASTDVRVRTTAIHGVPDMNGTHFAPLQQLVIGHNSHVSNNSSS